jgi:hypothetical protein
MRSAASRIAGRIIVASQKDAGSDIDAAKRHCEAEAQAELGFQSIPRRTGEHDPVLFALDMNGGLLHLSAIDIVFSPQLIPGLQRCVGEEA